jgi:hypothetical protein
MLARLPAALESGLELAHRRVHDEQRAVRLRSARDHVRDKVPVPWRVKDGDPAMRRLQRLLRNVHGDTSGRRLQSASEEHDKTARTPVPLPLFYRPIELPSPAKAALSHFAARSLIRLPLLLIDPSEFVQQSTHQGRFASIHVSYSNIQDRCLRNLHAEIPTNDNQIDPLLLLRLLLQGCLDLLQQPVPRQRQFRGLFLHLLICLLWPEVQCRDIQLSLVGSGPVSRRCCRSALRLRRRRQRRRRAGRHRRSDPWRTLRDLLLRNELLRLLALLSGCLMSGVLNG